MRYLIGSYIVLPFPFRYHIDRPKFAEKCEGPTAIWLIPDSPHALPAALMVVGDGHREGVEPLNPLYMGRFAIHLQSNVPNMPKLYGSMSDV